MPFEWDADIAVDERLLRRLLGRQFPWLAIEHVEPLESGWDNAVFAVNQQYVFRLPRRHIAVPLMEAEIQLLPWLAPHLPCAVPVPHIVGRPSDDYPFSFAGYTRIHGHPPYHADSDPPARSSIARAFGSFLQSLHSVSIGEAMAHGIAIEDSIGRMDLRKRIPLLLDKVEQACGMGYFDGREQLVHRVHALIDALQRLPSDPPPRAVVHGDLNFRNFLVDEAGVLSGVIDWGDAHIGDPAVDLSIIFSFCPPAARPPFFEVYGAVSPEMELLSLIHI